ncbi:MAG: endoribonuclease MazF [Candidatus Saccharimonadales bacterium]
MFVPNRGDIVWVNFDPTVGHEQAGKRPALILTGKYYNGKTGLMITCPITSKVKDFPFEVRLTTPKINGVVLASQVKTLDWRARQVSLAAKAPKRVVEETQELLDALLKE